MWWGARPTCDVLVVCTGNVCRSPYAAQRLAASLPALTVTAAGTGALRGRPPTQQVLTLLRERGVAPAETPARSLDRDIVRGARLILTAERRHRVEVVRLDRSAAPRVFTLRELARLCREAGSPAGCGVDGVLDLAVRSLVEGEERDHDDDLADPYGGTNADFAVMAGVADDALDLLVPALRTKT